MTQLTHNIITLFLLFSGTVIGGFLSLAVHYGAKIPQPLGTLVALTMLFGFFTSGLLGGFMLTSLLFPKA